MHLLDLTNVNICHSGLQVPFKSCLAQHCSLLFFQHSWQHVSILQHPVTFSCCFLSPLSKKMQACCGIAYSHWRSPEAKLIATLITWNFITLYVGADDVCQAGFILWLQRERLGENLIFSIVCFPSEMQL
jgi:hypothetical protein